MKKRAYSSAMFGLALVGILSLASALAGCHGADPVNLAIAEGMKLNLDAVRPDAELGLRVRSTPALAAAAGVPVISQNAAAFGAQTLDYQALLIQALKDEENGGRTGTTPIPAPPTTPPAPTPTASPPR